MFISKKELELREQLAVVTEECRQLRERMAQYEAIEAQQAEYDRKLSEQMDKMLGYTGAVGGKVSGG